MSSDAVRVGIDIGGSSVKAAMQVQGEGWKTSTSGCYSDPSRADIVLAIKCCLDELGIKQVNQIRFCLPGKRNESGTAIEWSANVQALNGWLFDELLSECFESDSPSFRVVTDADAAGYDYACEHPINGRTAAVSLGTGVGLSVFDGTQIATIGKSGHIGHLGHMDVGRHGSEDRVSTSGARNILESYIGAPSLSNYQSEYGLDLSKLTLSDPPISALVHALRMVHAIYLPDRIILLGGVGLAMRPLVGQIKHAVDERLTPLRRDGWSLECGDSTYHAAQGACRFSSEA